MQKLKLKTKKAILGFGALLAIILLYGFLTIKKEVKFNKYAQIKILNKDLNLGNLKLGTKIDSCFEIKNISIYPFVITEVKANNGIGFLGTRIKKLIEYDQQTKIYFQFTPKNKGRHQEKIELISNSDKGKIILTFNAIIN
jgi:hypothetical protein